MKINLVIWEVIVGMLLEIEKSNKQACCMVKLINDNQNDEAYSFNKKTQHKLSCFFQGMIGGCWNSKM